MSLQSSLLAWFSFSLSKATSVPLKQEALVLLCPSLNPSVALPGPSRITSSLALPLLLISSYAKCLSFANTSCHLRLKCPCPPCSLPTRPTNPAAGISSPSQGSNQQHFSHENLFQHHRTTISVPCFRTSRPVFRGFVFSSSALLVMHIWVVPSLRLVQVVPL